MADDLGHGLAGAHRTRRKDPQFLADGNGTGNACCHGIRRGGRLVRLTNSPELMGKFVNKPDSALA
jgi:hypothetical protein